MRFDVQGAFGDEYASTGVVREYKLQHPDEVVKVINILRPEIWQHNPYYGWGTEDSERVLWLYSWEPRHVGPRTHHYYEIAGVAHKAQSDLPELYLTPDELAQNLWVTTDPKKTIAIDPNAGWASRVWDTEKWHALSSALALAGYDVIHVGAMIDRPLEGAKYCVGRYNARQLCVLLSRCALYVGNDSGLFHVAASAGVPHVAVLGVSRFAAGPYHTTTAVMPPTACSRYCSQVCVRDGPLPTPHNFCMDEIRVRDVFEACVGALEEQRGRWILRPSVDVIGNRIPEKLAEDLGARGEAASRALALLTRERPAIAELNPWATYREGAPTPLHAAWAEPRRGRVYPVVRSKVDAFCLQSALGKRLSSAVNPLLGPAHEALHKIPEPIDLLYARDTGAQELAPVLDKFRKGSVIVLDAPLVQASAAEQLLATHRWKNRYRGPHESVWVRN